MCSESLPFIWHPNVWIKNFNSFKSAEYLFIKKKSLTCRKKYSLVGNQLRVNGRSTLIVDYIAFCLIYSIQQEEGEII